MPSLLFTTRPNSCGIPVRVSRLALIPVGVWAAMSGALLWMMLLPNAPMLRSVAAVALCAQFALLLAPAKWRYATLAGLLVLTVVEVACFPGVFVPEGFAPAPVFLACLHTLARLESLRELLPSNLEGALRALATILPRLSAVAVFVAFVLIG